MIAGPDGTGSCIGIEVDINASARAGIGSPRQPDASRRVWRPRGQTAVSVVRGGEGCDASAVDMWIYASGTDRHVGFSRRADAKRSVGAVEG